jgi:hypothetical protein
MDNCAQMGSRTGLGNKYSAKKFGKKKTPTSGVFFNSEEELSRVFP